MGAEANLWGGRDGKRLTREQRWTLFALWETLGVRPAEAGDLELWEFELAVQCMNERAEEAEKAQDGGASGGAPTYTVEQARAKGLVG